MKKVKDIRIQSIEPLISPAELMAKAPVDEALQNTILHHRETVVNIINGKDTRILGIVGPCSIHDKNAAFDYAQKLKKLSDAVQDKIYIVMRTYFEKPRTIVGWRGLITDPFLDGTYDIGFGLQLAREILIEINRIGLPVGCEMLDPIVPQYIDDLVSWAAIGARTTESQTHRNLASGLSVPVGFKNATSGNLTIALNAIRSAANPASFIGIDKNGNTSILRTTGNDLGHIILRGGTGGPNYYEDDVEETAALLKRTGVNPSIIIDCSHDNSRKRYERQPRVLRSIIEQIVWGNTSIKGFMLESNLCEGRQDISKDVSELQYGVSITDSCIGWEQTEDSLLKAYEALKQMQS